MKKIIIIGLIIIVAIVLGVVVALDFNNGDRTNPTVSNNVEQKNEIDNTVQNNVKNEINTNTDSNSTQTEDNKTEEKPKTDLEKAIDIVKKDWGEDESVYFSQEGKADGGEYIICVRDKSTTRARAWYTVNVETGTFTQEG